MVHHDHLVPLGVAVGDNDVQPREDFTVAAEHFQLAPFLDWQEIVRPVADVAPLVGIAGLVPASLLYVVPGLGECGNDVPHPVQPGATAAVIEMKMSKNYCVDVLGPQAQAFESLQQAAGNQPQALFVVINVFRAHTGIHQHVASAQLEQHAVEAQSHAVLAVGYHTVLPSHLGHLPKHRATVQLDDSVA